jgi:hypothetical protein
MNPKDKPRRRRAARSAAVPSESQIYDGSMLLGVVVERNRAFTAKTAGGRKLGVFSSIRDAMRALHAAATQAAPASRSSA